MTKNGYMLEIRNDILEWIGTNQIKGDIKKAVTDAYDTVTGHDSLTYYGNELKAEEALRDVVFDKEVHELFVKNGYTEIPIISKGAEYVDVMVREFLYDKAVDKYEKKIKEALR